MNPKIAKLIVDQIIMDLSDRGGIGSEWCQIDDDIRDEIRETWISIVMKAEGAMLEENETVKRWEKTFRDGGLFK